MATDIGTVTSPLAGGQDPGCIQRSGEARPMTRRSLLLAGAGAVAGGTVPNRVALGQTRPQSPIVLGQVSLSFYAVTGAVVQDVLERLGHEVEVRQGPHEQMFPLLGDGQIDLLAAAWLPEGHATYWSRYAAQAAEVARLYDGARFFWAVPSYVPVDAVSSIEDLSKPAVAERVAKLVQGIGAGAAITTVSRKALDDYGLSQLGYSLQPGTQAEWVAALERGLAEKRWLIFPTWAPQFLNRDGQLRALADPRGVLGGTNHASLVAPRPRFEALPEMTRRSLARIELGIDGVTEMDWLVNVGKQSPREAARTWMRANEGRVSGWLG
ncbi:MAG TPA: glycine betaine ABC transporter substrate-binding protein [Bosea sp. (in: a-proteobacteria)]|uniref:glycine betaine ABC transporter substrate-binding protein n=1 Tax=Bosea sp. (in: a-proteobacteria) TaxID=1871050 RepID=UPI002E0D6B0D|nr:glycine betaine ABC transporter substrate-binding protein [Bosea sp. (in: a-proteobacteria)]